MTRKRIGSDLMLVVGTRPEIIKMAPVVRALLDIDQRFVLVHTCQHSDYELSCRFFKELGLPNPDHSLSMGASPPTVQTAKMMMGIDRIVDRVQPRLMLIQGDTNSMLAAALTGFKSQVHVGHVEAGLRSYDWRMPEEHNRRMVDHASEYLFAPTEVAKGNLLDEKVPGKIWVTGNTVIDSVIQHLPMADRRLKVLEQLSFQEYLLATAHRAENVDDPMTLKNIVEAFEESPLPVVFPVHPRTLNRLRSQGILRRLSRSRNVKLMKPQGYFDFLVLMRHCKGIITDSGGLQEEATAPLLRKAVLVMRRSTERPEAVQTGFARVAGTDKGGILEGIESFLMKETDLPTVSPYGDGHAGKRIVRIMTEELL